MAEDAKRKQAEDAAARKRKLRAAEGVSLGSMVLSTEQALPSAPVLPRQAIATTDVENMSPEFRRRLDAVAERRVRSGSY